MYVSAGQSVHDVAPVDAWKRPAEERKLTLKHTLNAYARGVTHPQHTVHMLTCLMKLEMTLWSRGGEVSQRIQGGASVREQSRRFARTGIAVCALCGLLDGGELACGTKRVKCQTEASPVAHP